MVSLLSLCSSRTLAVVLLAVLCSSLLCETRAQQFYPNGRYGRRSVIPPLAEDSHILSVFCPLWGDHTGRLLISQIAPLAIKKKSALFVVIVLILLQ
ncbi:hypothetical protein CDAR_474471 [Caerostris darwini]|uniref:Secreted protein n=1 Tax=Caerostris darwini TaxID=1538125 RepID=A0AAV4RC72_9ARAC|nr:hypothetical protein CDAR_474471 [Caerostris darwini]